MTPRTIKNHKDFLWIILIEIQSQIYNKYQKSVLPAFLTKITTFINPEIQDNLTNYYNYHSIRKKSFLLNFRRCAKIRRLTGKQSKNIGLTQPAPIWAVWLRFTFLCVDVSVPIFRIIARITIITLNGEIDHFHSLTIIFGS